jgi:hypothetical protein
MKGIAVLPGTRRAGAASAPLGQQLRAARERRGAALEQVSEATRIRGPYLEALERHDWQALPAEVFTRGYLRSYADFLGLDQERLLKAYARERRIAGADAPVHGGDAHDPARAFLERLAKTRGVEVRRFGARSKRIVLGLGGGGVLACALWALPGHGWIKSPALAAPSPAPGAAAAVPARPRTAPPAEVVLPTAEQQPPTPAPEQSASHLKISGSGVGTSVVRHRLVGRSDRFREGTVVWFWTRVVGGRPGDKVQHVWLQGGHPVAVAELDVRGASWRTQSRRPLPGGSTGDWRVEARDPEGRVIASADFTCVPAD